MDKDLYLDEIKIDENKKLNKYYRAYRALPRLQKALDHEREVNHKLYSYALTLEQTIKHLKGDKGNDNV